MSGVLLFRIICRIGEEPGEDPSAYPIDTVNDYPIDICIEELRVLDQDQPSRVENFSSTVGEQWFRSSLAYCCPNLVLDSVRELTEIESQGRREERLQNRRLPEEGMRGGVLRQQWA